MSVAKINEDECSQFKSDGVSLNKGKVGGLSQFW